MTTHIKFFSSSGLTPTRGSSSAACYDLASAKDYIIRPGETIQIQTGLRFEFSPQFAMLIFARSSLHRLGNGCHLANSVGVVDADYRGEILLIVRNPAGLQTAYIERSQRVAQFMLVEPRDLVFQNDSNLSQTDRGSGGFGSTGKL